VSLIGSHARRTPEANRPLASMAEKS